jgi:hypothetical protein
MDGTNSTINQNGCWFHVTRPIITIPQPHSFKPNNNNNKYCMNVSNRSWNGFRLIFITLYYCAYKTLRTLLIELTPRSTVLFQKTTVAQIIKKFLTKVHYGVQKSPQQLLTWARRITSTPSHSISLRSTLILSSDLRKLSEADLKYVSVNGIFINHMSSRLLCAPKEQTLFAARNYIPSDVHTRKEGIKYNFHSLHFIMVIFIFN